MFICPHCKTTYMAKKDICSVCGKNTNEKPEIEDNPDDHFLIETKTGEARYKGSRDSSSASSFSRFLSILMIIIGVFGIFGGVILSFTNTLGENSITPFIILGGGAVVMLLGFVLLFRYFNKKITNAN